MSSFPYYKQRDNKDCGPTCLRIIAKHYKKSINIQQLRELSETTRTGSSLLGLSDASEKLGFRSLGIKVNLENLLEAPLPSVLHWNKNHYVVLYKIKKEVFYISDPGHGLLKYSKEEFLKHWIGNNATDQTEEGIALLLEPTPKFYNSDFEPSTLVFSTLKSRNFYETLDWIPNYNVFPNKSNTLKVYYGNHENIKLFINGMNDEGELINMELDIPIKLGL